MAKAQDLQEDPLTLQKFFGAKWTKKAKMNVGIGLD
jgi:hypothetical protein